MKTFMTPRMQAVDKAVLLYEEIKEACCKPDKSISGETLEIYKELVDWGFIEKYSISDASHRWLYVVVIAMNLNKMNQVTPTDSYVSSDQKGKWQIIQAALEKTGKVSKKKP